MALGAHNPLEDAALSNLGGPACTWLFGSAGEARAFCARLREARRAILPTAPRGLLAALAVSLLAGAGTVVEYAFILSCLAVPLPFWQTVAAWTAGWVSFLVPLPGGLGALEASQVLAFGIFGVPAASAISVTLVLRGRDLVLGGLGLLLAGREAVNFKSRLDVADVLGGKVGCVRRKPPVQESSSAWEDNNE